MFSDRSSNLNPFQSGRPTRFCAVLVGCHITRNSTSRSFCCMRSRIILSLFEVAKSSSPESQVSRGEGWTLTLHVRYPRTFADSLRSCAFIPQTLKNPQTHCNFFPGCKNISYHFSNLARLTLEPLTKRFTLLLTMYLGQMIRYRSNDGTKDLVLFGSQVVIRISLRGMALRFRLCGIL